MHLRGLGNLCSSAVYDQGQLTLIFNTISWGLQSKAANNRKKGFSIVPYSVMEIEKNFLPLIEIRQFRKF